jgi:transcriptional regulator with XRE-family HTH domain
MNSAAQRMQLSEFLKSCRARMPPSSVGLPEGRARRTAGLRREDVAAMAGLSVTWYTWLEQGRDIRASDFVLERLARMFKLSADERDYLFSLAQNRLAPLSPAHDEALPDAIKSAIDALTVPAEVITLRWDVVYWNVMVTHCIRDYTSVPADRRNLLRILLTEPEYQQDREYYERMSQRVIAKFRVDYSQAGGDPAFETLIEELIDTCPRFKELWRSPDISSRSEGVHLSKHPRLGGITFEHSSYVVEGAPRFRMVVFVPFDEESARKVAEIAREKTGLIPA